MDTPQHQPATPPTESTPQRTVPPLRQADRSLHLPDLSLDQLLEEDHIVRWVWDFALSLDLHALTAPIKAVEHHPGRPSADPRLLVAMWLFATIDAVTSARRLARLCDPTQGSLPYLWL